MPDHITLIVEDVRIFTGHEFIDKGFVVVQNDVITDFGHGKFLKSIGEGTVVLSHPGDTLIPGLIDAHIHALSGNVDSIEQSLRFGVTTVCDMHNDPRDNKKLKQVSSARFVHASRYSQHEQLATDSAKYADFKCAGLGAVIEGGWPIPVMRREFCDIPHGNEIVDRIVSAWPKLKAPEDAEPFVKQQVEENGASYIKMFHELGDTVGMELPPPPMDIQIAVVEAAHKRGVLAVGHAFSYAGAMALLHAGVDGLTHIFLDDAPHDDFVQLMVSRNAHCNPTLCLCASQTAERQEVQHQFTQDSFAQEMLTQKECNKPLGLAEAQRPRAGIEHAYKSVKALYTAGVPLIVGTDAAGRDIGAPYGLGMHIEMHSLVHDVGMTPLDVLKAATSNTADRFGFHDRGKIEVGRKADFVLVSGDIEAAMAQPERRCLPIKGVWREGVAARALTDRLS